MTGRTFAIGPALAMAAAMSLGIGASGEDIMRDDRRSRRRARTDGEALIASMVLDGAAARPTFTSEKPLTKRQRRRQRGKGEKS